MTAELFKKRYSFDLKMTMALEIQRDLPGRFMVLTVHGQVPHRNTGQLIDVVTVERLDMLEITEHRCDEALDNRILSLLVSRARHEVCEKLMVDGERMFDPHELAGLPEKGIPGLKVAWP